MLFLCYAEASAARTAETPSELPYRADEVSVNLCEFACKVSLHQLRAGYDWRPGGFPWSVAFIGLRAVRDYKVASGGSERLNTASPFNQFL